MPSTSIPGPPITTSVWTEEKFRPRAQLVREYLVATGDAELEALAPGDVTADVLVVQRVVEGHAGRAHPRRALDQRDLTQAAGPFVRIQLRPHGFRAGAGLDVDGAATLEGHHEVLDEDARARHDERPGRADDTVGAAPVRAGEDLLGRQVGHVRDARRRSSARRRPRPPPPAGRRSGRCRRRDSGRRPGRGRSARLPRAASRSEWARHSATTSSLSSRMAIETASQSRSMSGSPKTCWAQPGLGAATMFQTTWPPSMHLAGEVGQLHRHQHGAGRVHVVEDVRVGRAGEPDQRDVVARPGPHLVELPVVRRGQGLVRPVQQSAARRTFGSS